MRNDYSQLASDLEVFLAEQIESLSQKRANYYANELVDEFKSAIEFNKILRDAKPPQSDIDSILKSNRQLELAINSINDIGTTGQIALSKALRELHKHVGLNSASSDIVNKLNEISEILIHASQLIDKNDKGVISHLIASEESYFKKTKTENWIAKAISEKAAKIYEIETGRKASLTNTEYRSDDEGRGKFFVFLKGVFDSLGINASVEASIKKLRKIS